jgi:K+ transporter
VLTALGVVYGDIGTSALYGLQQAVDAGGAQRPKQCRVVPLIELLPGSLFVQTCATREKTSG